MTNGAESSFGSSRTDNRSGEPEDEANDRAVSVSLLGALTARLAAGELNCPSPSARGDGGFDIEAIGTGSRVERGHETMVSEDQGKAIKEIAGRLAWNKVWQYERTGTGPVLVVEVGQGRTVSSWHWEILVGGIRTVLGPDQDFVIEGIEDIEPETWVRLTLL